MTAEEVIRRLVALGDERARDGMARVGINTDEALGIRVPQLRELAREIGRDHPLALELWQSGIHEARILASMIAAPEEVDPALMEAWARDFDSWDLCDQVCGNLFDRTPYAWVKAVEWSERDEEFVKRAGFALMANLALHDKDADDASFEQFLPIIEAEAEDTRNFVTKAISWALRQIGKRSPALHGRAVETAGYIADQGVPAATRVAREVLAELSSAKVRGRLGI